MATSGHTTGQPGLRGHSFSEDNLLKQFLVLEQKDHGRLAVKSFDTYLEAATWLFREADPRIDFLIKDQFKNKIVYNEAGDTD